MNVLESAGLYALMDSSIVRVYDGSQKLMSPVPHTKAIGWEGILRSLSGWVWGR